MNGLLRCRRTPVARRTRRVAIWGRANVGKSTLINGLAGELAAVVSSHPGTTRHPRTALLSLEEGPVELVDLPAYVESPANAFEEGLLRGSNRHLQGADAILMVVDGSCLPTEEDRKIVKILLGLSPPTLLVLNKTDILSRESHRGVSGLDVRRAYLELGRFGGVVEVSAELGLGLDTLRYVLASILPSDADHGDGDPLIPRRPDRAGVADMVRERLLHHLRAELPSASVVHVQDIETRGRLLVIRATIHVERSSQQAIVIGSGGIMIRRIGTEARRLMEAVYGKRVFLDLRVRVSPGWKKRRSLLRQLGYDCG